MRIVHRHEATTTENQSNYKGLKNSYDEDYAIDRYQCAFEYVKYEGQLLWQIFSSFLLAHTVFLAYLLQSSLGRETYLHFNFGNFLASIVGLFLCLPWAATFSRSSSYYNFRMAQAKEAEPSGWNIIKNNGEAFSAGKEVFVGGQKHKISTLATVLRTKRSVPMLIFFFFLIYLGVLLINGPWYK